MVVHLPKAEILYCLWSPSKMSLASWWMIQELLLGSSWANATLRSILDLAASREISKNFNWSFESASICHNKTGLAESSKPQFSDVKILGFFLPSFNSFLWTRAHPFTIWFPLVGNKHPKTESILNLSYFWVSLIVSELHSLHSRISFKDKTSVRDIETGMDWVLLVSCDFTKCLETLCHSWKQAKSQKS